MLEHGGRLRAAAQRYSIPLGNWLDLSTGVSPHSWLDEHPVALSRETWARLPEDDDDLIASARKFYGASPLMIAGSQAAIQALPRLRAKRRVGVLSPGYAEHAHAWRRADHDVIDVSADKCEEFANTLDVLVLTNPNNPTGATFEREDLLRWRAALARRGGWLIVDEAFMDATPERSLVSECETPGLIVLRSLGKFFGLAGLRVGGAFAAPEILRALAEWLGPWPIAGGARRIASLAYQDEEWQHMQRQRLHAASERLRSLLVEARLEPSGGCELFQWVCTRDARATQDSLAKTGILVRAFDSPPSLRFGLPRTDTDFRRLELALR